MELKFPKLETMHVFFCQGRFWAYDFHCLLERKKKKQPTRFLGHYDMSFSHILCEFLKGLIALDIVGILCVCSHHCLPALLLFKLFICLLQAPSPFTLQHSLHFSTSSCKDPNVRTSGSQI